MTYLVMGKYNKIRLALFKHQTQIMNCHVTSHWEKGDNPLALRPGGNVLFIYTNNDFHHTSSSQWYKSEELPYCGL